MASPVSPGLHESLDWPTIEAVRKTQSSFMFTPEKKFTIEYAACQKGNDIVWIPPDEMLLQLPIRIVGHTEMVVYRDSRISKAVVEASFWWDSLTSDVESFLKFCIQPLSLESSETFTRSFGHTMHDSRPEDLLYSGFHYLLRGENDISYVLVFENDRSGYAWFISTSKTTADTVADAFLKWFRTFGNVFTWISDRGSHFRYERIRLLREALKSGHHLTLNYII